MDKQARNYTRKLAIFGGTAVLALALSACSGNNSTGSAGNQPTNAPGDSATQPPVSQVTSPPANNSNNTNNGGNGVHTGSKPTSKPQSGQQNGGKDESKLAVGKIFELAKEGKVPGCSYAAHTSLYDDIEKVWGKADHNDSAGKGMYAEYKKRGITFGYNKGMVVFDVRSYSKDLHSLTLKNIESALGKADETTVNGDDHIYTYNVNKQYQLKFVIPASTNKVDHISVYSPDDTKNLMAG
ncbi:YjgB family protein [Paenibacillus sp. NPDC058174]|uniref:YjgB family protein n=1 Tax=Paenibacillus sp. NPDC058174 TaxID=3346366 RepID=UPI0036D92C11